MVHHLGLKYWLENVKKLSLRHHFPVDNDPVRLVLPGGLVEHGEVLLHHGGQLHSLSHSGICLLAVFHLRHPEDTDQESDQSAVEGEVVVKEEFDAAGHRVTEKRPLTVNNLI